MTTRERNRTRHDDEARDREVARRCLQRISPDCSREEWIRVGMALRSVGDDLRQDWHEWSSRSPQYSQREAERQWSSFAPDGGVGLGTLTRMAGMTTEELRGVGSMPKIDAVPMSTRVVKEAQPPVAPSRVFASREEAVTHATPKGFRFSREWRYTDDWWQVRLDGSDGKQFRPVSRTIDGWVIRAPDHRPLYRVEELPTDHDEVVLVVEGEKCADIAHDLGFAAVTCANGAQSPHKSEWSPLKGRAVAVLPDHDDPGRKFSAEVKQLLEALGCTVSVVELPGLKDGEDIEQWRDAHGDDAAAMLRDLVEESRDHLPLPDMVEELQGAVDWCDRHQGRDFIGLPCGTLPKLDRMLDGWRGLVVLAGAPGCGKTTLVLSAAVGVAHRNTDAAVLVLSLEMSRRELMHRMILQHADKLDWHGLVKGRGLDAVTRERDVLEAQGRIAPVLQRLKILEQSEVARMAQSRGCDVFVLIRRALRELKRRTRCPRGMLVIDNLATLPVTDKFDNELERERSVTNRLMELQEATGDAVLVIAQQNKEAMRSNGRGMAGVKGAVEQVYAADAVLMLTKFQGALLETHPSLSDVRTKSREGEPLPIVRCSMPKGRDGMSRHDLLMLFDHEHGKLLELDARCVQERRDGVGDDDDIPF